MFYYRETRPCLCKKCGSVVYVNQECCKKCNKKIDGNERLFTPENKRNFNSLPKDPTLTEEITELLKMII
ncbi:MAG: hypothetical protein UT05_C0004G0044 [Parcubacteria group bacterium GW2011_GWF2_38_76]|nr:MAG: hypothetical protein UT05_C0004G0044 [Parcubacteria group bacterium GW2011_GWF2_38_76]HBM45652.1 hypothetical protein [Patescibacteria group bacterium]